MRLSRQNEEAQSVAAAMARLSLLEPPESVWTAIEAALDRPAAVEPLPAARPSVFLHWRFAAALALLVISISVWYSTRPPRASWDVVRVGGSPVIADKPMADRDRIAVGDWLTTDASSRASIAVGTIGSVSVEPNTRLRLTAATPGEHRLTLSAGEIHAKISAPPRLFFVDTAVSTAVDLGCVYTIRVDQDGTGLLQVTTGWVLLQRHHRESLVPAGANCRTRPPIGPGTPYFADASESLRQALDAFDFSSGGRNAVESILSASRVRDTLTLWHLVARVDAADRETVVDRIIALTPLPRGVTREKILALDPQTLEQWKNELAWTW